MPKLARYGAGAALAMLLLAVFLTMQGEGTDATGALSPAETESATPPASGSPDLASPTRTSDDPASAVVDGARVELAPRGAAAPTGPIVLHGVSIDRAGEKTPLVGGRVEYSVTDAGADEPAWRSGVTGADGRFTFPPGTQLGEYRLRAPGHLGEDRWYDPERHGRKLWLHLDQLAELRVEVLGPDGVRRAGVPVRLARQRRDAAAEDPTGRLAEPSASAGDGLQRATDVDGRASWTAIAPGLSMGLVVEDPVNGEHACELEPFSKGELRRVRVQLEYGTEVTVEILDQRGQRLDGAQVTWARGIGFAEETEPARSLLRELEGREELLVEFARRRGSDAAPISSLTLGASALEPYGEDGTGGASAAAGRARFAPRWQVSYLATNRTTLREFAPGPFAVQVAADEPESGDLYFGTFEIDELPDDPSEPVVLRFGPHHAELTYGLPPGEVLAEGTLPLVAVRFQGPTGEGGHALGRLSFGNDLHAPLDRAARLWVTEPGTYTQVAELVGKKRTRGLSSAGSSKRAERPGFAEFTAPGRCHVVLRGKDE